MTASTLLAELPELGKLTRNEAGALANAVPLSERERNVSVISRCI